MTLLNKFLEITLNVWFKKLSILEVFRVFNV